MCINYTSVKNVCDDACFGDLVTKNWMLAHVLQLVLGMRNLLHKLFFKDQLNFGLVCFYFLLLKRCQ